jgi:hypothetical protein
MTQDALAELELPAADRGSASNGCHGSPPGERLLPRTVAFMPLLLAGNLPAVASSDCRTALAHLRTFAGLAART